MQVIFSKIKYEEVKEKREQALKNSDSMQSLKEQTMHYFKRLPFAGLLLLYTGFIFNKCFVPVFMAIYKYIYGFTKATLQTQFANNIRVLTISMLAFATSMGIIAITVIFAYKILFSVANRLLPRKTPLRDREEQNRCFWNESKKIKNALCLMNEISKLNKDDIAYSDLIFEESTGEVTVLLKDSEKGYITKRTYSNMHEDMKKKLEETGVLDFTPLDKEWNMLLQKYQIEQN